MGESRLLNVKEAAKYLGISVSYIYKRISQGTGPRAVRIGRLLRFYVTDLDNWAMSLIPCESR